MSKEKKERIQFTPRVRKILTVLLWLGAFSPVLFLIYKIYSQDEERMPSVEVLENPPELLASIVLADDGKTELGRYWSVNRTPCKYKDISPYVIDALIATEDERYMEHSGIDFKGLARAIKGMGRDGGASTITQQLAKLLFTLQERSRQAQLRAEGKEDTNQETGIQRRLNEKIRENIIAVRLEERYTKEEIITMYLNQFDFLHNAVGIANASRVYFNKKPSELSKLEAAMLVGMCKNPSLYNPYTYQTRLPGDRRDKDSTRMINRRNTVLNQWLKNSLKGNEALSTTITQAEYDSLKVLPMLTDYQVVDHKEGIAPHFRESLRKDLKELFAQKNEDGSLKYKKKDGTPYNIYKDGLRIYTTINVDLQDYAEKAVRKHLKKDLQPAFSKNNASVKRFPFSDTYDGRKVSDETIENIMQRSRKTSARYYDMSKSGKTDKEIFASFETEVPMRVFSWDGEIDTIMTPNDSIRYYKNLIRAGLVSIEPSTGFVKAWVGGADFNHFAYDQVSQGSRQVGSTMKPFVYATAISMGVVKPCTVIEPISYCVDPCYEGGQRWCPAGKLKKATTVAGCLAASNNPGTVAVMSKMGACSGPQSIAKNLARMDIDLPENLISPSMCLGTPDISLLKMTGAQAMFVNNGMFIRPMTIMRIEDRNGNVIYSADPYVQEVMNPNIAYETLKMMKGVVEAGTSTSLRGSYHPWGGITHPTAGKTGTTQGNSDGWFMGLTPDLVTGVWAGGEDKQVRFRSMTWGQGARMALPIYGYYMQQVYKDKNLKISTADFEQPIGYDPELFSCEGDNSAVPTDGGNPFGI